MRSFIAAAILACGISSASAAPLDMTVQGLYQQCKSEDVKTIDGQIDTVQCYSYISGVGDLLAAQGASGAKIMSICAKSTPSYGAMVQAFVNWAEAHPQEWGKNRLLGVVVALGRSWLCR
jgi:hypothetical protein